MKLKGIFITLAFLVILSSFVSADIIISQQPAKIYNFGEAISIPITIKSLTETSGMFEMNLICSGQELNFYKNGIMLGAGQEKRLESSLVLSKSFIGTMSGECILKAILGSDYVLTDSFEISNSVTINIASYPEEVIPGDPIEISGNAIRKSGVNINGFIDAQIFNEADVSTPVLSQMETVDFGLFALNLSAPANIKAGKYTAKLRVYERDSSGEITNEGYEAVSLSISQIPKNLEIIIEPEVEPGTPAKIQAILHDQTGENIPTNASIEIRNSKNKLLERKEVATGEIFEFPIASTNSPEELKISAEYLDLVADASFKVKEKSSIKASISNNTLTVTNTGNVPYCEKTLLIKIGEESVNLDVCLNVGKEKKYTLAAPDGEYQVEVLTEEDKISQSVALTGKAIDVKEVSEGVVGLTRHPFIWVFVILVMGFFAAMIFRKGYKRSFIGRIGIGKKSPESIQAKRLSGPTLDSLSKKLFATSNPAVMSSSISGSHQKATLICLKIKNMAEVKSNPKDVEELLSKISNIARDQKMIIYESGENVFLILAPSITKTFQNEQVALKSAEKIKALLDYHNKVFKQKVEFGISLSEGEIVAKQGKVFEFMALGDLMLRAKKTASASNGDILLDEKIRTKFGGAVKSEKVQGGSGAFRITEMKDSSAHEKFIRNFLNRNKTE